MATAVEVGSPVLPPAGAVLPAGKVPAGPEAAERDALAAIAVTSAGATTSSSTVEAAVDAEPQPMAQHDAADSGPRTLSSRHRPPPSPFEGVPLDGAPLGKPPLSPAAAGSGEPAAVATAAAAAAEVEEEGGATNGARARSPRGLVPTKSALKMRQDAEQPALPPAAMDVQQSKGLSWADTHGQAIHHVQEYQPSEHESEGHRKSLCGCCMQ